MAALFFADDPARDQICAAEVETTVHHWQHVMLQGLVDDLDTYLDAPGTQRLRQEAAEMLTTMLSYRLHGCLPRRVAGPVEQGE